MILELLLNLIFGLLNVFIDIIPILNVPAFLLGGIAGVFNFLHTLSFFIPLSSLITCIVILIAFDLGGFAIWIVNFLIKKIPTI